LPSLPPVDLAPVTDSGNHDLPILVIDVIDNPIIANPNSIRSIAKFLGIRPARVFANLFTFLDDPLTKHLLHARSSFSALATIRTS
jgi:hypothetical protein